MCVFSFFLSGRARAVSLDRIGPIRYTPRALYTPRATLGLAFPVFFFIYFSTSFLSLFFYYFGLAFLFSFHFSDYNILIDILIGPH